MILVVGVHQPFTLMSFLQGIAIMPDASGAGSSGQPSNRAGKGKNNAKDRGSREESVGDSKDGYAGNVPGVGMGNASEGKGGSGINRVNREYHEHIRLRRQRRAIVDIN
jgi:hypothetical protein